MRVGDPGGKSDRDTTKFVAAVARGEGKGERMQQRRSGQCVIDRLDSTLAKKEAGRGWANQAFTRVYLLAMSSTSARDKAFVGQGTSPALRCMRCAISLVCRVGFGGIGYNLTLSTTIWR